MSSTWIIIIAIILVAVLICFLLAVANFAYDRFLQKYKELDKVPLSSGLKAIDLINIINNEVFLNKLEIFQISQYAGDAYSKGKLFLSTRTINNNSLASITIIAHELGHAKQDKESKKLKWLKILRYIGKILGLLMPLFIVAGIIMLFFGEQIFTKGLIMLAIAGGIFLLALFNKLFTISIEKDASKKAVIMLKDFLTEEELKKSKKFLKDARLTYWADFLRVILGWTALSRKTNLF